jgi:O-antigen/teichoic acid export membrane protein
MYMTAIQNVFAPQVYKRMFDMGEGDKASIGHYLTPFCYVSILLAILISLFSEEIIFIVTPPSYHGAADIVIVLSMLFGSYFFGKQPQLIYAKKTHITSVLTIVSIGLNILINIPFIMKWGAIGAAWGTLLAGLISGGISFVISQHYFEIKWEYKNLLAIFAIFYCSSLGILLSRYFSIGYEARLILKCVSLFIYLYLGVRLRILTRKNYLLVRNMVPLNIRG